MNDMQSIINLIRSRRGLPPDEMMRIVSALSSSLKTWMEDNGVTDDDKVFMHLDAAEMALGETADYVAGVDHIKRMEGLE